MLRIPPYHIWLTVDSFTPVRCTLLCTTARIRICVVEWASTGSRQKLYSIIAANIVIADSIDIRTEFL